ncbi:MAG: hypothetical protein GF408_05620 [Candidatus Omnitrophica bacterium]|nr:hypothetical protein [Candidatus Omnitrophota bacterium]
MEILKELLAYIEERREIMLLPVLLALLFVTAVIVSNRDVVQVPFVYSGF